MQSLVPGLKMLVVALVAAVHGHPDPGVVDGMAAALAAEPSPVLESLAEDAALLVTYAEHESHMELSPRPFSWDSKAGLANGYLQLWGADGKASPERQATTWLLLLRAGARLCPESPSAPLSGGCGGAALRIATVRMLGARALLARVVGLDVQH